jgi:hypothetical protein
MTKRSRLVTGHQSGFQMVWYSNARDRHKIESEYRQRFGIRMYTVFKWFQYSDVRYSDPHCTKYTKQNWTCILKLKWARKKLSIIFLDIWMNVTAVSSTACSNTNSGNNTLHALIHNSINANIFLVGTKLCILFFPSKFKRRIQLSLNAFSKNALSFATLIVYLQRKTHLLGLDENLFSQKCIFVIE